MRFLFGKTAFSTLLLMICYLLSSVAIAADVYDGIKSDIQAGRTEIALGTLQEIIKQQPDAYQAWFLIGVAHAREQQFHQAIEAFRHVIELNPRLAEPHNNLAVIYNELGDVRAAVNELEQSLKKRPDYAFVEENIADLYVKLALQNYRSALEKEPREGLEKRYMRLLQVRDPTALSGLSETVVTVSPSVLKQGIVSRERKHVADQAAAIKPEQIEALPKELPVMDLKAELSSIEPDEPVQTKNIEKEVLEVVETWRVAWASRDLTGYFLAYAKDFQVPKRFDSFERWQQYKKRVIGSKTYIQIELNDIHVELDKENQKANVKFLQKFSSNSYNGDDLKVLEMKLEDDVWKIVSEVSVS